MQTQCLAGSHWLALSRCNCRNFSRHSDRRPFRAQFPRPSLRKTPARHTSDSRRESSPPIYARQDVDCTLTMRLTLCRLSRVQLVSRLLH